MSILTPLNEKLIQFCKSSDLTSFIKVTGALGQVFSSFAFIGSIATNDELPQKQKGFLTAQEAIEGIINVSLFCLFTSKAKSIAQELIRHDKNIFFPSSLKKQFRRKRNGAAISNILGSKEMDNFRNAFPDFAGFAGSVGATAIISPIIKNITSAVFLKVKATKDKKEEIEKIKINTQSLRKKTLPIDRYITTVTSPKGMRI